MGGETLATATMLPARILDSNGNEVPPQEQGGMGMGMGQNSGAPMNMNQGPPPGMGMGMGMGQNLGMSPRPVGGPIDASPLQRRPSDTFMQPFEMISPPTPIKLSSPGPVLQQPQFGPSDLEVRSTPPNFGAPMDTPLGIQQGAGWGSNNQFNKTGPGSVTSSTRSSLVDATLTSADLQADTWGANRIFSGVPPTRGASVYGQSSLVSTVAGVSNRMTPPPPAEDSLVTLSSRSQQQGAWETRDRESDRGSERSARSSGGRSPFPNTLSL
jgi:hypothetical protein